MGWRLEAVPAPSPDEFADGLAVVDVEALAAGDFEAAGVEAELVQDRGVDVSDVVAVLGGVEADLVSGPMHDALSQPASSHPDAEAEDGAHHVTLNGKRDWRHPGRPRAVRPLGAHEARASRDNLEGSPHRRGTLAGIRRRGRGPRRVAGQSPEDPPPHVP